VEDSGEKQHHYENLKSWQYGHHVYDMPCSLVASPKHSDEMLPPSSGRRAARSRFPKHQTARRHLPAYSNPYSNRDDKAWNKQAERCHLFVYGHNTVVSSCVS